MPPALDTTGTTTTTECVFVTGPHRSGKTNYIQQQLANIGNSTAVLLISELPLNRQHLATLLPSGTPTNTLQLPCICCPELISLPTILRSMTDGSSTPPKKIFIKLPDIVAPRLIAQFDNTLAWPRQVILCQTPAWTNAAAQNNMPLIQTQLHLLATQVINTP